MTELKYYNTIRKEWQFVTPFLLSEGKLWYPEMKKYINNLAKLHNLKPIQIAGIFSCLSPQKSVSENKKLCEAFLNGKRNGHYKRQINKAKAILDIEHHKTIEKIIRGNKTKAFYRHLHNPKLDKYCCIDTHMIKICNNGNIVNITPNRYRNMSNAVKRLAKEVNLHCSEVQSCLWLLSKQKYGNKI